MPAKTPLASDKTDALAACAVPFHPYCGDVVTRTRNVSKYMLALALCLVIIVVVVVICLTESLTLSHFKRISVIITTSQSPTIQLLTL